eukprot:scaffold62003_cov36-Cyclotella_meneghiniana.AAC.3
MTMIWYTCAVYPNNIGSSDPTPTTRDSSLLTATVEMMIEGGQFDPAVYCGRITHFPSDSL